MDYNSGYLYVEEDGSAFHYTTYSKSESFKNKNYGVFDLYIDIDVHYEIKK